MGIEAFIPYVFGAVVLAIVGTMVRGAFKHGGFKGMLFDAGIRRTVGEVEGVGRSVVKTVLKVHVLDGAPQKAVGLEFVAKSFASYQMLPFVLSTPEARQLIVHMQAALDGR